MARDIVSRIVVQPAARVNVNQAAQQVVVKPKVQLGRHKVKRQNKVVQVPKVVKSQVQVPVIRPVSANRGLGKIVKQPATQKEVRAVQNHDRNGVAAASKAVVQRTRALHKGKAPRRNPVTRYLTRDVTNMDLQKIKQIRGSGRNKVLVIVANGPSILEVELERLRGYEKIHTMSINKPDARVWPTTYWAFFDVSQIRRHAHAWETYEGTIFNSTSIKKRKPNTVQIKNVGGQGFSKNLLQGFHIGRSSVFAAMQLGLWMDYDHIYIFGCDMAEVGGRLHFYGQNPDVDPNIRKSRFEAEASYYDDAASRLSEEERARFTFCSSYNPFGFVKRYNRLDHKVAADAILKRIGAKDGGQLPIKKGK